MTSQAQVVVVGGGMAGARLARQLGADEAVRVTVLGEEPDAAYNRVLLGEVLAGRYAPEVVALPPAPGARFVRGVRAVRLDRAERLVQCDDGSAHPYDQLVLATGSNPVLPPLRGLFGPGRDGQLPGGVHPFRTMDDCRTLAAKTREGLPVVVIGGGLLGVTAARALAERGARVVLAHQGEHLMERQLDSQAAQLLRAHLDELGVETHTECRVRGLRTTADRAVSGVEMADGFVLEAELVVLACGVRPRVGLAQAAGLTVDRGVVVDDRMRTSDPRVLAVGDCAQHDGTVYGLAGAAQEQAEVAARVLLGDTAARYRGTRALTRLTLAAEKPLDLAAFGETRPRHGDDVVHLSDATRSVYRKVVVRDDRLVGGILLGDLGTVGALARAWEGAEALPDEPLVHLLTDGGHRP